MSRHHNLRYLNAVSSKATLHPYMKIKTQNKIFISSQLKYIKDFYLFLRYIGMFAYNLLTHINSKHFTINKNIFVMLLMYITTSNIYKLLETYSDAMM